MSLRCVRASFGPMYFAVCNECKRESDRELMQGVAYSDNAVNVAYPHGWTHENARATGGAWAKVQLDYCPECSVAPEYRKQS